jgi:hypothetical protein
VKFHLLLFSIFIVSSQASARLELPKSMGRADRIKVVEILGLGSSQKITGNPFPLGGYSGVEVGLSTEILSTSEVGRLGLKSKEQAETNHMVFTMGKGLFNDFDVFLSFSPFSSEEEIRSFGAQLRWGLYQAEYLPAHLSLVASANSLNFQNIVNVISTGADLVAGFTVEDVTLFTGLGLARSSGQFVGQAGVVAGSYTDTGETETERVEDSHYLAGINIRFSSLFLAFQLDRYTQATYSAKIGTRF